MNKYSTGFWTTFLVFLAYQVYHGIYDIPPMPDLPKDQWWGSGIPPAKLDTSIRPFEVKFKQEKIDQLKSRLRDVSWLPKPLEGAQFNYGFNSNYLKEVVDTWRTSYDFAARQKHLNRFPQFKTNIQGLDIHYIHISQPNPKNKRVIPILMIYCWPINNHKLIQELLKPRDDYDFVFTAVVPSLPGFGYSEATKKPGLGAAQMAVILNNLMKRLKFDSYVVHGGDLGAEIGAILSVFYPNQVQGLHSNLPVVMTPASILKHLIFGIFPSILVESKHVPKLYPLTDFYSRLIGEYGHLHLQATKPDTFGVALQDSPVGLAAYLLEKFSTGTNLKWKSKENGGLPEKFCLQELLDNVMVYWDSGCITSSMRIYAESFKAVHRNLELERIPVTVPTVAIRAENDIVFFSSCQLRERFYNLIRVTDVENAGHFAGFEVPEVIANDIWKSIVEFQNSRL